MQNDPRMKDSIQDMRLQNGRIAPCLRDSAASIDLFLTILKEQKLTDLKHGTAIVATAIIVKEGAKMQQGGHKK